MARQLDEANQIAALATAVAIEDIFPNVDIERGPGLLVREAITNRAVPFCSSLLDQNPLHLIERHLVAPAIVELGGAGAGMVSHGRGLLECAAVF
jgi:hypothetical protein